MSNATIRLPLDDIGRLVLRLTLGILMLFHGVGKVLHGISPIEGMMQGIGLPGFLAYAVFIGEVVAPVLLIVGYRARLAAGLIVVNMIVAILLVHTDHVLALTSHGGWRLELQGFYLFTAVALMLIGPGRLSIEHGRLGSTQ